MRTTLDLDESVLAAARALAADEGVSLGAAVSTLARRGLEGGQVAYGSGFPVFHRPAAAPPITLEIVNDHRDDD